MGTSGMRGPGGHAEMLRVWRSNSTRPATCLSPHYRVEIPRSARNDNLNNKLTVARRKGRSLITWRVAEAASTAFLPQNTWLK